MKKTILVVLTLVSVMVTMLLGATNVEASTKETPLQTAQKSARTLYGVKNIIDKGEARAEKRFMTAFKQQGMLSDKIKDKKMKKVVKKMDKVIRESRIDYNAGNKKEALERVIKWVEKDYEKTIDTLYKKK